MIGHRLARRHEGSVRGNLHAWEGPAQCTRGLQAIEATERLAEIPPRTSSLDQRGSSGRHNRTRLDSLREAFAQVTAAMEASRDRLPPTGPSRRTGPRRSRSRARL